MSSSRWSEAKSSMNRTRLSGPHKKIVRAKAVRWCLVLSLAPLFLLASCQKKEESLSLLVWEGYADSSFLHAFEEAHHCKVSASYMGSSDDLVAKLRGGSASNYDVISPSSDVATS